MGKYKRLGVNTFLIFMGNVGSKLIGLIMLPLYTRWLGPEQYGLSDILSTYATVLLSLVTCSISEALFVFPKDKSDFEKAAYFTSGVSFIFGMSLITALLFFCIERFSDVHNSFIDNIWLLYILLFSQILQTVLQQFTRSIDKINVYSITGFVVTVFTALFGGLMIPKYGLIGFIWSLSLANIIGGLYSFVGSRAFKFIRLNRFSRNKLFEMLTYSLPLVPTAVTWWVIGAMNRPIMETYVGFYGIGIYAVASKFSNFLNSLFVIFGLSWQISVLEEYGKPGYPIFFNNAVRGIFAIISIGVIVITLFSKQIITILAAPEFYKSWTLVPILLFGTLLGNLGSMVGTNFLATKKSKYMLYTSIWGSGAALLFNYIFIPLMGINGAAISTVGSMFVLALTRILYSSKFVVMTYISHYIITIILVLGYIVLYRVIDNIFITSLGAIVGIIVICFMERGLILSVFERNKHTSAIINKIMR